MRLHVLLSVVSALTFATPALAAEEVHLVPADSSSFTVDATVYHMATPDIVNISVSCDMQTAATKAELRQAFREQVTKIKALASGDAQVRRNGSPSLYSTYSDPSMPSTTQTYTGNMQVSVLNIQNRSALRIGDGIEDLGCTITWDARLVYATKYAEQQHDELFEQIADKKAFYEKLLGVKMSKVSSMSVSTLQDYNYNGGYGGSAGSYDPETNTIPAMTMLSITFDTSVTK